VRVAISLLERAGLLRRGFDLPREVAITVPRRLNRAALADHTLARLFKGLQLGPDQSATFALTDVARFMRWPLSDAEAHLLDLSGQGVFSLKFGRRAMFIELPAEPDDLEARVETLLAQSLAVAQRRIDDVIGYTTTDSCRHGYISAHFGSPPRTRCEVCDNCTGVRPDIVQPERVEHLLPDDADIEPMIIDCLISLPRPVGRSGLARILIGALRSPIKPDQARHFGALKALGEGGVIAYIDDLIVENRLRQYTRQDYLVLAPTLRGRTEAETWLSEHPELATYGEAAPETEASTAETETESDRYTALQKALWLWRRRLADELVQPVYVVMRNELMLRIAEARPQTLEALAALPGMGAQRMQHYGEALLDIVKLNPPQPGDDERLAVQRAELDAQASGQVSRSPGGGASLAAARKANLHAAARDTAEAGDQQSRQTLHHCQRPTAQRDRAPRADQPRRAAGGARLCRQRAEQGIRPDYHHDRRPPPASVTGVRARHKVCCKDLSFLIYRFDVKMPAGLRDEPLAALSFLFTGKADRKKLRKETQI
jgi:hypothetical protein